MAEEVKAAMTEETAEAKNFIHNFIEEDIAKGGQIGAVRFTAAPVRHPVPSYAVRFEHEGRVLCYSGDTNTCDTLKLFVKQADLFLCDACFTDALWQENLPHLSASKAAEAARAAGVKRLMLTHFRPDISKETLLSEAEKVFANVCLAQVGLKAEI